MSQAATIAEIKTRDPYRAHGTLVQCPGCGVLVRRIELEPAEGEPSTLDVAPFPLPGNWDRALYGFGEGRADGAAPDGPDRAVLYTFPTHLGKAQGDGWKGGARRFEHPPPTVSGYRPHHFDCPASGAPTAAAEAA